jgi:hypothetical protein
MSRENGETLRTFTNSKCEFVCSCLSPRQKFLYAVDSEHQLICYDVATGAVERTFGVAESPVTGIVSHPFKNLVGTYANEGSRGKLKLWIP